MTWIDGKEKQVMSSSVDVVMCGDKNVLLGMAVVGRTALEHSTKTINFWIICKDFSQNDKSMMRASWDHPNAGSITFSDIPQEKIKNFRSTAYLKSKMAYSRFFIADIFCDVSKCIYLDTDLLVMRDLSELMNLDLGKNAIAACVDISVGSGDFQNDYEDRLGINDYRKYFNSGVILMDLDFWRREDISRHIIKLSIEKRDILHSQDQDALNIIFENKTLYLDSSWNTSQYEKPNPITGKIVHLIGSTKPWHAGYQQKFRDNYYRDIIYKCFFDFVDRTAYRGRRPWNPLRFGEVFEYIGNRIPTNDMVSGKFRRLF